MTNKTTKLIELIQVIYTQKGNADSRANLGVMLNDLVKTAREEERERIKEKYGHFKYKCCVHSWDGCLRLQKELDYEKCFK